MATHAQDAYAPGAFSSLARLPAVAAGLLKFRREPFSSLRHCAGVLNRFRDSLAGVAVSTIDGVDVTANSFGAFICSRRSLPAIARRWKARKPIGHPGYGGMRAIKGCKAVAAPLDLKEPHVISILA